MRASDRTMAMPLAGYASGSFESWFLTVNVPGDQRGLSDRQDFLLVGVKNVDPAAALGQGRTIVETLALIPYDPERGAADLSGGRYFSLPPDFR